MNRIRPLVCLVLLCASSFAAAQEFYASVVAVLDGDTVLVRRKGGEADSPPEKVRLVEIDAPEKEQPFGEESRRSLADMLLRKQVRLTTQAVDDYGRLVAHIELNGLEMSAEQVRRGMAWENSHYHRNHAMVALENAARQAHRGLWAGAHPVPPWEWRKLHPMVSPPSASVIHPPKVDAPKMSEAGCGRKKRCSEMTSCAEARHYLVQCGIRSLDANGDGVPCEKLCRAAAGGN